MSNFIINEEEKSRILSMHRKLIKEQQEKTDITEDPNFTTLKNARNVGCLSNGDIFKDKTKNIYFYRKPSTKEPTKEVDFFADMTYKFVDGSKSGKWKCEGLVTLTTTEAQQQSEINQLKKQFGWKTREDLKNIGQDELTQLYQKHPKFDLYKLKIESGKVGEYTEVQQKFIDQATSMGYKLQLTPEETASGKYKQYKVPNSENYFPDGLTMFYSPETAIASGSAIQQSFGELSQGQAPKTRKECAEAIKTYYEGWETRREFPQNVFDPMKRRVQACVDTYGKKFSSLGGLFSEVDNYIDTLSGGSGGPLSYGEDAKWRIMPPKIIKKNKK